MDKKEETITINQEVGMSTGYLEKLDTPQTLPIVGRTIKSLRFMTKAEMDAEGWERPATVIELNDGTIIYSSKDEEGNGAGCLFCKDSYGYRFQT
jgi:hypothetical protein